MTEVIAIQPQYWIVPTIGAFILVLGLICFGIKKLAYDDGYVGGEGWLFGGWFLTAIALIFGVIWCVILIPFDSKYHVYFKLSGTVESVTNTLQGGGDGERTLNPVVRISGYDQPIQMYDSRIVTLKGQEVDLKCTYDWNYEGLDGTDCSIRAIK
jgi:uncharacterized membrane protein